LTVHLYLCGFIVSVAMSLFLTYRVQTTAVARGLLTPPISGRHLHTKPLPRLGGVAIYLAFVLTILAFLAVSKLTNRDIVGGNLFGFLVPTCAVFLMGVYDDLKSLEPKWKLTFEALAAALLYSQGFGLHRLDLWIGGHAMGRPVGFALSFGWVLLMTNAFNLIDGLDGLAAGSALVSLVAIMVISFTRQNEFATIVAVVLFGTLLGFMPFNFYPATIFMGDSGSLFVGFSLGALSLQAFDERPILVGMAVPILCFGLPILDVALAVVRRFLKGQSLFSGDADHVHHKLLKRGLSQRGAVLLLYGVTAAFVFASILLIREQKMTGPVLVAAAIGVCAGVQQLRYAEFSGGFLRLRGVSRRRNMARSHEYICRASQSLRLCADFTSICQTLKENLQPIGIDGIRLDLAGDEPLPALWLDPLRHDSDGRLHFAWSKQQNRVLSWEGQLPLVTANQKSAGNVSLLRMAPNNHFYPESETFSDEFSITLSNAIERATTRMKVLRPAGKDGHAVQTPKMAADSLADSA
jgi:UDP-GlcNAc:undecaprenyl-phosphate/decaprenyl-phosphate GlcNAc-1-phosphate transferase